MFTKPLTGDGVLHIRWSECDLLRMVKGFSTEMEDVECGFDGCQTSGLENRACFPIFVSPNDTDFGRRKRCLMFVRSQEAPNDDCVPGPSHRFFLLFFSFIYFLATISLLLILYFYYSEVQKATSAACRGSYYSLAVTEYVYIRQK